MSDLLDWFGWNMKIIKIGTRQSQLAVAQSKLVADYIEKSGFSTELVKMKTTGDVILDRSLAQIGGKGLFVKELDQALMDGRSDLSVHSLKDVPVILPKELPLIGFSKREDPRDVLVLPKREGIANRQFLDCTAGGFSTASKGEDVGIARRQLDFEKPIGCSSKRRIMQAKRLFPNATFADIRGNVNTRLAKLDAGEYSALILAAAGLKRLGMEDRIYRYFSVDEMIPSAGQGILALQGRAGENYSFLNGFVDSEAQLQATAERAYVQEIGGDCTLPIGAHAVIEGKNLTLYGMYATKENETNYVTGVLTGEVGQEKELGAELARMLLSKYEKLE